MSQILFPDVLINNIMENKSWFDLHYQQNYEAIYKFCFRFLNCHENALDITQETFIKFYERMNQSGTAIENPKAWLYKVSGNLCLNAINNKNRREIIKNSFEARTTETSTPESILIRDEKNALIRKIIGQLKPESRLLVMMYQDGLSYREMAEATGIPETSVGKTLWRIIEKISQTFKSESNE